MSASVTSLVMWRSWKQGRTDGESVEHLEYHLAQHTLSRSLSHNYCTLCLPIGDELQGKNLVLSLPRLYCGLKTSCAWSPQGGSRGRGGPLVPMPLQPWGAGWLHCGTSPHLASSTLHLHCSCCKLERPVELLAIWTAQGFRCQMAL